MHGYRQAIDRLLLRGLRREKMRPEPAISVIRDAVHLDRETGALTWKRRALVSFRTAHGCLSWNGCFPGKPAFATLSLGGYLVGAYDCRQIKAHRVVWAIVHGRWPQRIDHINGNRADNRPENLREATQRENGRNMKRHSRNKTGVAGVSWNRPQKVFRAFISTDTGREYLGRFKTVDAAAKARKDAERRYGYHENHGRDAPISDGPCGCMGETK